jgi:hypothetical protein
MIRYQLVQSTSLHTVTMIYTALGLSNDKVPQHHAFQQRKLNNLTQAKMSDLTIHGKPVSPQVAYDGYRANIEAFLWATAKNQSVSTVFSQYPLPNFDYTFPLRVPKLSFLLKDKPTDQGKARMLSGWDKYGIKEISMSKTVKGYTIDNPDFSLLLTLRRVAVLEMGTPEGYATVASTIYTQFLYKIIDLFCSVNTYPAFSAEEDSSGEVMRNDKIYIGSGKRAAEESEGTTRKRSRKDRAGSSQIIERITDDEGHEVEVRLFTDVVFAKPSPMPSSTCFGRPSEVPFLPGILFPYFDGLLAPDPVFIRRISLTHFFRLLCDDKREPRDFFKDFKNAISPFAYTREGVVFCHILKGVELSLETQTQLYLLFDHQQYLGFCLLGARFHVFSGNRWEGPVAAEDLRTELQSIMTHDNRMELLVDKMKGMKLSSGGVLGEVAVADVDTSCKLAKLLGRMDLEGEDKDKVEAVKILLEGLSFPTKYQAATRESILAKIPFLYNPNCTPPGDDEPVHIPIGTLHILSDNRALHLLTFGSRSPSFYSSSGKVYSVPGPNEKDGMLEQDPTTKRQRLSTILVTMKTVAFAFDDLKKSTDEKAIRFDERERAKDSRCIAFKEKVATEIWTTLKSSLGVLDKATGGNGKGKQRAVDDMDDGVALDDLDFE